MIFLLSYITAFLFSIALVPLVIKISQFYGWIDAPNARKIHLFPIARLGGLAMWLSSMVLYGIYMSLFFDISVAIYALIGSFCALTIGLWDDFMKSSAKKKLLLQMVLGIVTYAMGIQIEVIHLGIIGPIDLGIFSLPITVLWVALMMNAFNMIDGMDGLAASFSLITLLFFGFFFVMTGNSMFAILCFLISGASLGFFLYNYHPAKIFMGDGGSMFLGYTLAIVSIQSLKEINSGLVWIPLIFLSYPLIEVFVSIFRRAVGQIQIMGRLDLSKIIQKAMSADGDHVHHRLLKMGFTQRKANFIIMLFVLIGSGSGFLLINMTFTVITAWFLVYLLIVLYLLRLLEYEQFNEKRIRTQKGEHALEKKFGQQNLIKKVEKNHERKN